MLLAVSGSTLEQKPSLSPANSLLFLEPIPFLSNHSALPSLTGGGNNGLFIIYDEQNKRRGSGHVLSCSTSHSAGGWMEGTTGQDGVHGFTEAEEHGCDRYQHQLPLSAPLLRSRHYGQTPYEHHLPNNPPIIP